MDISIIEHKKKVYEHKIKNLLSHIFKRLQWSNNYVGTSAFTCNVDMYFKYIDKLDELKKAKPTIT